MKVLTIALFCVFIHLFIWLESVCCEPFRESFEKGFVFTESLVNCNDTVIFLTSRKSIEEWPDSNGYGVLSPDTKEKKDFFFYRIRVNNRLLGVKGVDRNHFKGSIVTCNGLNGWYEPSKIIMKCNDTVSAINGNFGFRYTPDIGMAKLERKIKNDSSIYVRFNLCVDSIEHIAKKKKDGIMIHSLSPGGFLRIYIKQKDDREAFVVFAIEDDVLKKKSSEILEYPVSIRIDTTHCIEYLVSIDNSRRMFSFTAWLDEKKVVFATQPFYSKSANHSFYSILFGVLGQEPDLECLFRLDDIAYDTYRLGMLSTSPELLFKQNEKGRWYFDMRDEESGYEWIELQIAGDGNWRFPLLSQTKKAPLFRISLKHFPYDTDSICYRLRSKQQGRDTGYWSEPKFISNFNSGALYNPRITNLVISSSSSRVNENTLVVGKWYNLVATVDDSSGFNNLSYCHFLIRHESHPEFNVTERGDNFNPASNYMVSYSLSDDYDHIYIHEQPGSDLSRKVCSDCSLYVDCTRPCAISDSINGTLSTNFRLLPEALEGTWVIDAVLFNKQEKHSKSFRKYFTLVRKKEGVNKKPFVFIVGFLIISVAVFLNKKMRHVQKNSADVSLNDPRITSALRYINENLTKKISVESIALHIRMSDGWLITNFKKETGMGIPAYINEQRVSLAKSIMKNGNNNISEVSYAVGFSDPTYFNKVFKAITGKSPSEFLKS